MYTFFDRTLGARRDAQRRCRLGATETASCYAADVQNPNIRGTFPEGTERAETPGIQR